MTRRKPIVEISGRVSLRIKTEKLQIAIERELGLPSASVAPEQLELAIAPASIPERSALRVRPGSTPARGRGVVARAGDASRRRRATRPSKQRELALPCGRCKRRGYHLKNCPLDERRRSA